MNEIKIPDFSIRYVVEVKTPENNVWVKKEELLFEKNALDYISHLKQKVYAKGCKFRIVKTTKELVMESE
jgi:hypothetical protein